MTIAATLLPEFEHEMKTTRRLIERVPDASAGWKPHAKSMSLGQLAVHIPGLVNWIPAIVNRTELDMGDPENRKLLPPWESAAASLALFDRAVIAGREAISAASDADLLAPWTLKFGGNPIMTSPRTSALRTIVMNHVIHHRGQLSVYLRLNDIPVPEVYGPTADSVR